MRAQTTDRLEVALRPAQQRIRGTAAAAIGNASEYYDFFLYGTAAALVFSRLFFPSHNPALGMVAAFAGYAVGFISRPLGGMVFGHIGDRYGRKVTLTWTLSLMGVATFLIGVLPTYDQIGPAAPTALLLLRLLQGFAAGGEWGGAILMATENAPPNRRGLYGAWSQAGIGAGFVLSAGAFFGARMLAGDAFLSWGWRVPFLVSVLVVAVGLIIRARVPESSEFQQSADTTKNRRPIREVLQHHGRALVVAGGLRLAEMSGQHLMTTFALAYGHIVGANESTLLIAVIVSMMVDTIVMLLFGSLSDRIGRKRVYGFGIVALGVFCYPFLRLITSGSDLWIISAFIVGNGICHAAMIGVQPALLTELFPVTVRSSGLAMAQAAASIVVGFVPMTAMLLYYTFASILPVAIFMITLCAISYLSLIGASRISRAATAGRRGHSPATERQLTPTQ